MGLTPDQIVYTTVADDEESIVKQISECQKDLNFALDNYNWTAVHNSAAHIGVLAVHMLAINEFADKVNINLDKY